MFELYGLHYNWRCCKIGEKLMLKNSIRIKEFTILQKEQMPIFVCPPDMEYIPK